MTKWYVLTALIFLTFPKAHAIRTTAVMPISMSTVAGGSNGSQYCITADMQGPTSVGPIGQVINAYHTYSINFRNLSTIAQNVTIVVEPGSSAKSQYSTTQPAPNLIGPTAMLSSISNRLITLAPGEARTVVMIWGCSRNRCWLGGDTGNIISSPDDTGPGNICLTLGSRLQLSFSVAEDRGAIIASIACAAHRNMGATDKYDSPPPFILINGGRPF